jgi:hypothetical protein
MTNKSRMDFRWISIAGQARDRTRCRSRDVAMRSSGSTSDGLLLVGGNDRREDRDRPLGGKNAGICCNQAKRKSFKSETILLKCG